MKATEIREMTVEELDAALMEKKEAIFKLRFQHAMGQLEDNSKLRSTRRDIARLLTIKAEKGDK